MRAQLQFLGLGISGGIQDDSAGGLCLSPCRSEIAAPLGRRSHTPPPNPPWLTNPTLPPPTASPPGVTKNEMLLWHQQYLACCAELNQWDTVRMKWRRARTSVETAAAEEL